MTAATIAWAFVLAAIQGPLSVPAPAAGAPHRVYDTERQAFVGFEAMADDLARQDLVFLGEQHDDPNTHRLEAAVLEALRRRSVTVLLSFEMFERDVQPLVDAYLAGREPEAAFLAGTRPWPRYATDYRPLIEIARAAGWPILAANVPRRLASAVARDGSAAIAVLPGVDRPLAARDVQCPHDGYFDRFAEAMAGHDGAPPFTAPAIDRYYLAQCFKDETMAEAIARAAGADEGDLIVHVNGAFHSDYGLGTVSRVRRRLPQMRIAVVSFLPVDSLDALVVEGGDTGRARYLVYTLKPR